MSVSVPVDLRQLLALAAVSWRELRWVLPNVKRDIETWLRRAEQIPDGPLRRDAVSSLVDDHFNVQGAALFASLPAKRNLSLVRLLSAYQVMFDYLDTTSERPCADVIANGTQLHRAALEALDPETPISDYYRLHPWKDDGGYLRALVEACRRECRALPSFDVVRPHLVAEASRLGVCAINHELDPTVRDAELRAWVRREFRSNGDCEWFEISAAATSSVTIFALMALAAEPNCTEQDVSDTRAAYFPWISLESTMLDSFTDLERDLATGAHSYVSHYSTHELAVKRLGEIVARSVAGARKLPQGRRHALIAAGMAAMYLSDPTVRHGAARASSEHILRSGGNLPRMQLPILHAWRRIRTS